MLGKNLKTASNAIQSAVVQGYVVSYNFGKHTTITDIFWWHLNTVTLTLTVGLNKLSQFYWIYLQTTHV